MAFGILALGPAIAAVTIARVLAALAGRECVDDEDAVLAAALVLAPRATQMPMAADMAADAPPPESREPEGEAPPPPDPPDAEPVREPPREAEGSANAPERESSREDRPPEDVLTAATLAALPPGLLAQLAARAGQAASLRREVGRVGMPQKGGTRGRICGARPGNPFRGARLDVIETLRAAAPWQRLRTPEGSNRLAIRREDFRIVKRKARTRVTTLFVVDASGSSALQRLGEAKGAVQRLLAECYVRRDEVALIAFRSRAAELVLPPTRALTRASRALAGLPGGGGTPLATAIDTAREVARGILKSGRETLILFMTDARANIARDGSPGREAALRDAEASARALAALGQQIILIDTSPRPSAGAERLAGALQARYAPLPAADSDRFIATLAAGSGQTPQRAA